MDKKRLEQPTEADEAAEELPKDHSGFEHYCNHFRDDDDTFFNRLFAYRDQSL